LRPFRVAEFLFAARQDQSNTVPVGAKRLHKPNGIAIGKIQVKD
jgi:hypothetical protein